MCTFFVKKPKQNLKFEHFQTIIENNPQGFGFVYTNGTKLMIVKSASPDVKSMWKKYQDAISKHPESHFIGHGRIATGSNIDYENTHPFYVHRDLALVHNGIIRQFPSTAKKSDTWQYIDQVLRKLPDNWVKNKSIMDMIGRDIVGSKFAMLTASNKVYIVNRHACVIDKETGILFSNNNYNPSEWLDYGGTKISKHKYNTPLHKYGSYSTYKGDYCKTYKMDAEQSELDFHVDMDKGAISEVQNDYMKCPDCGEWGHKKKYHKEFDVCNTCAEEYGWVSKSGKPTGQFELDVEGLCMCDDCGVNIAELQNNDWSLCKSCHNSYTDYDLSFKPINNNKNDLLI